MQIAVVLPDLFPEFFYDRFRKIFREEFQEIDATYLFYRDYKDAPKLLRDRQREFDAVIFAGAASMHFTEKELPRETLWVYLPTAGSSLYRALLDAMRKGWDITRLSFDTYQQPMLDEVYQELGYHKQDLHLLCFQGNPQNPDYNGLVLAFHQNALRSGRVSGCITRLVTVANMMKEHGMAYVAAFPTYNTIREQVEFAQRLYLTRKNAEGEFVAVLVHIAFPPEFSTRAHSNYQFVMNRMRISSQVYRYADLIRGSVVEQGVHDLMIFATRDVVELQNEFHPHIPLLDWMSVESPYPFYLGVGFGKTLSEAQYHANRAIQRSYQERKSCLSVLYANGALRLTHASEAAEDGQTEAVSYLMRAAKTVGLSYLTLSKIATILRQRESDVLTSQELAEAMNIGKRSADRLLEKLELNGYAAVVGRDLSGEKGRPSRKIQLFLTK